ncbi:MAG: hypothetical protein EXS14_08490 [Planctomycetes bacterium]|nr:hypothetical protein [Planctomycetota bacterium]
MKSLLSLACVLSLFFFSACGDKATPARVASGLPESNWLSDISGTPRSVREVISNAKDGQTVLVTGRVGGTAEIFVPGRATFLIADLALKDCYDMTDECKQPWDYCCEDPAALQTGTLAIEFHANGKVLSCDARGFHGLDHGNDVSVQGVIKRTASGSIVLVASGVNVSKGRAK